MANVNELFTKVVYLVTGSGIGPALPHLMASKVPAQLVWATRNPRTTYGDALVDEILAVAPDATIWNTDEHGKPDLVQMAYAAYLSSGAEAVICISNKKVTWQVVHALECRGIPTFGPIWDSSLRSHGIPPLHRPFSSGYNDAARRLIRGRGDIERSEQPYLCPRGPVNSLFRVACSWGSAGSKP